MSYELRDVIRQARVAIEGNPWTGKLEKYEVQRAVDRLIEIAEQICRENERLKSTRGNR